MYLTTTMLTHCVHMGAQSRLLLAPQQRSAHVFRQLTVSKSSIVHACNTRFSRMHYAIHKVDVAQDEPSCSSLSESSLESQAQYLLYHALVMGASMAYCQPSWAASAMEAIYNPEQGSETLKNVAGIGYIILVIFYFFRLFKKRAERAASVPLGDSKAESVDQLDDLSKLDEPEQESEKQKDVTVLQCFIGVAQAGTICYLFYLLSRVVDDYFLHQDLPSQYTARNITLLIQSVVRGLVYLVTFIFGANATGLAALAVQLVLDPEGVDRGLDQSRPKKEILPKVKVTDDLGSIRRAFKEAEQMGKNEKKK